jgi:hypothetical protein
MSGSFPARYGRLLAGLVPARRKGMSRRNIVSDARI